MAARNPGGEKCAIPVPGFRAANVFLAVFCLASRKADKAIVGLFYSYVRHISTVSHVEEC